MMHLYSAGVLLAPGCREQIPSLRPIGLLEPTNNPSFYGRLTVLTTGSLESDRALDCLALDAGCVP